MYCEYYGFTEEPFDITPDPSFLFLTPGHEEILTSIVYGIQGRRGLMAIIGEVGTGKTTILNTALEWLSKKTKVAYVINFDVSFEDLLAMALVKLGLVTADQTFTRWMPLTALTSLLANSLPTGAMWLSLWMRRRILTIAPWRISGFFPTWRRPSTNWFKSFYPGSRNWRPSWTSLKFGNSPSASAFGGTSSPSRKMKPTSTCSTAWRWRVTRAPCYSAKAPTGSYGSIPRAIPRKINILCDNALLIGFRIHQKKIHSPVVQKALQELRWSKPEGR